MLRQATQKMQRALDDFFKATTKDIDMFMANQSMLESRNSDIENIIQSVKQEDVRFSYALYVELTINE